VHSVGSVCTDISRCRSTERQIFEVSLNNAEYNIFRSIKLLPV